MSFPQAEPVYDVGLPEYRDTPEPVQVQKPDALPPASCCRLNHALIGNDDKSDANAHLLAALGGLKEPFVPV